MTTTKNNRLITEFMGLKSPYELPQFGTLKINGEFKTEFNEDQLKYHKDWNWLMEVVDKIDSIELKNNTFAVDIFQTGCQIFQYGEYNNEFITTEGKTRIEATYDAVVRFIKWYNKQK
jgi:hypothetical protein